METRWWNSVELLEHWPGASTAPDGPPGTRPWRRLRLIRNQHEPDGEAVVQEILDAWRLAERELAARVGGVHDMTQLEVRVATLRSLYHDLSPTIAGGRPASWDRLPHRRAPRTSRSQP
jgi:hypothetical protein